MPTELEHAQVELLREHTEVLTQVANELATLNKTLKLIAETLRGIMNRLP